VKILYIGEDSGTSRHRKEAMIRLGHQVTLRDPYALLPWSPVLAQWQRRTGGFGLVDLVRRRLLGSLGPESFDVAWVDQGALVSSRLIGDLKERASKVLNYNVDDPFGNRDASFWRTFLEAVSAYDILAVVRNPNIEEAYRLGAKRVLHVHRSADEVAHAPRLLTPAETEAWRSEVAFVGTAFPERGPFLAELVRLGVPLTLYGNRYDRLKEWPLLEPHWRAANTDAVESYASAISAARICLGLLSRENRDLHTTRSMEIPALGNVLCAERTPEHCALYEEDREAVFWSGAEECAAQCLALLADEPRRLAIAAAGRQRFLKNGWRNERVVQLVLDSAFDDNAGSDAGNKGAACQTSIAAAPVAPTAKTHALS
jgi:hypothetical protein